MASWWDDLWNPNKNTVGTVLGGISRVGQDLFNKTPGSFFREFENWANDRHRDLAAPRHRANLDRIVSSTKSLADQLTQRYGGRVNAPVQDPTSGPRDLMSALSEAFGLVGGGNTGISYDPLRNDARARASEYDARMKAMYDQLMGSIRGDAAGIQQNFQGAIDSSAERSQQTQGDIQGASDAANQRNLQQLESLGLGEAAGNIVAEGRDLNTATSRNIADAAARGQIQGDRLETNQQASLAHNTNLAGAAGLEGNLQRARIGNELSSLLAQYDMEEQAANRQAQQNSFGQAMSLAQALVGDDWQRQGYQDDLDRFIWEQSNQPVGGPDAMTLQYISSLIGEGNEIDPELMAKLYSAFRPRS